MHSLAPPLFAHERWCSMTPRWKIAGINFDHFHIGDLLRMVSEHEEAEIVGICDASNERMQSAIANFDISDGQVFNNVDECLEKTKPDVAILCPATADHAAWTEAVAKHNVHILIEKPFASTVDDADRMIAAADHAGKQLAINWPLRWVASHVTAHRFVMEGRIGEVREVHYYDGNRGPLWHGADKIAREPTASEKAASWFYKAEAGGGSLLDYLGYGTTLGTWFLNEAVPLEVSCLMDEPEGLEVDEHSITIARYDFGLSKFETRWGTYSDPWTHQPQPKCGFVLKGSEGTISSYDYAPTICWQHAGNPAGEIVDVEPLQSPYRNPVEYFLNCLESDTPVDGPLSPRISRIGQRIVDTAFQSAKQKRTLPLVP